MGSKFLAAAVAASSLMAAPVAAAAANPAASLSVARSVTGSARAATPSAKGSRIAAGSTATLISVGILVAFAAVVIATTGDDEDNSDSN